MINSSGDDFFLPDSAQFYFNDLLGVKYLRYVPNTGHSLSNSDAFDTLRACYAALLTGASFPQFSWSLDSSNVLRVVTATTPSSVNLWQATNPNARDFRFNYGTTYTSSTLSDQGGGTYVGTVPVPSQGWTAFFIELTYPGTLTSFKFTTQVYVVPDTLPYHWPP
jgi:PhoPQ-activated pathogenicity-related protein